MRTEVQIFTFKEGLLARLAHDLRLRVQRFEITLHARKIEAWFDASSLEVEGVAHGDRVDETALSDADKHKIRQTIQTEILDSAHFPRIELSGTLQHISARALIDARLRLRGVQRAVQIPIQFSRGRLSAELSFAPSLFGIAPYKALAGAIRVKDSVTVRVATLEDSGELDALGVTPDAVRFSPT